MSIKILSIVFLWTISFPGIHREAVPQTVSEGIQFVEKSGKVSVINDLNLVPSVDDCKNACLLCEPDCQNCVDAGEEVKCPKGCLYCDPGFLLKPAVFKGVKPGRIRPCPEPPAIPLLPFQSLGKCDVRPDAPRSFLILPFPKEQVSLSEMKEKLRGAVQSKYKSESGAFVYQAPDGKAWISVVPLGEMNCFIIYRDREIFESLPVSLNGQAIFSR